MKLGLQCYVLNLDQKISGKAENENWLSANIELLKSPRSVIGKRNHCTSSAIISGTLNIIQSHLHSLQINLETFHFSETVRVFSNPTPITQSSINHLTEQKPATMRLIITNTPHALNIASSPMSNEILDSPVSFFLLINTRNKKIKS